MHFKKSISILFLICISLPLLLHLSGVQWSLEAENRKLADMPSIEGKSQLSEIPEAFDAYFEDHLPIRPFLVKNYNTLDYVLGGKPSPLVMRGQNAWLFLHRNYVMDQILGKDTINRKTLAKWNFRFNKMDRHFNEIEARIYYTIAPNKHTIYAEYLPEFVLDKRAEKQNIDRFYDQFNKRKNLVDLRPGLYKYKSENVLYEKWGTHWTSSGAFLVYQKLMENIQSDVPDIPVLHETTTDVLMEDPEDIGLIKGLGVYQELLFKMPKQPRILISSDYQPLIIQDTILVHLHEKLPEWNTRLIRTNNKGPKLLIIRDSFFNNLIDYFTYSFSEILIVHHKGGKWHTRHVADFNPDIVIWELVERNLLKDYKLNISK